MYAESGEPIPFDEDGKIVPTPEDLAVWDSVTMTTAPGSGRADRGAPEDQ